MKKLLVALLVVFCGLPCLAQTREPVYVDGVNVYSKPKIYANSFDGFLNMRSAPSTSAKIVGAFRNGEIPGYVIKQEGNWAKIYYQGVTGYVYKKNTTSTPTVAVTIDVDGEWLQGVWVHMEGFESYAFFNNGTYQWANEDRTEFEIGTYRLAGNLVVLTPVMYKGLIRIPVPGGGYTEDIGFVDDCEPTTFVIDIEEGTIDYMSRLGFVSPGDEYACYMTYEQFLEEKAAVKALLGK